MHILHKLKQVELNFKTGEVILVYGDMDEDGFYMGELDGVRGLVPSNFLTEAPDSIQASNGINTHRNQNPTTTSLNTVQRNNQPTGGVHLHQSRGPPPPPPREMSTIGKFAHLLKTQTLYHNTKEKNTLDYDEMLKTCC